MSKSGIHIFAWHQRRAWLKAICLIGVLLLFLAPATVLAGDPSASTGSAEECSGCHHQEATAWEDSAHAQRGVTCQACHGAYVEGHPENGMMLLEADSDVCEACHAETYAQWSGSAHAAANVQCIGCHNSHSQGLRLSSETLCLSCHTTEDDAFSHAVHQQAGVVCEACHVSPPSDATVSPASATGSTTQVMPSHSFEVISDSCIGCHVGNAQPAVPASSVLVQPVADPALVLSTQLKDAEQANSSLQTLSVLTLGLGLGIGAVLGVIFTLIVLYISQERMKKWPRKTQ